MRLSTPRRADRGFTLVEVLVALAVAGGALILVLSANNAALRQSVQAREDALIERAAETKLEESLLGQERGLEGELPGLPGRRWSVRVAPVRIAGLKKLKQATLSVHEPDGTVLLEWLRLEHQSGRMP